MTTCLEKGVHSFYRACLSITFKNVYVRVRACVSFPFGFMGSMWDLIVLVPDHCHVVSFLKCPGKWLHFIIQ